MLIQPNYAVLFFQRVIRDYNYFGFPFLWEQRETALAESWQNRNAF